MIVLSCVLFCKNFKTKSNCFSLNCSLKFLFSTKKEGVSDGNLWNQIHTILKVLSLIVLVLHDRIFYIHPNLKTHFKINLSKELRILFEEFNIHASIVLLFEKFQSFIGILESILEFLYAILTIVWYKF